MADSIAGEVCLRFLWSRCLIDIFTYGEQTQYMRISIDKAGYDDSHILDRQAHAQCGGSTPQVGCERAPRNVMA